jgi:hypothetical protein
MHEPEEGPRTLSRSLVDGILGLPRLVTKRRARPCDLDALGPAPRAELLHGHCCIGRRASMRGDSRK